MSRIRRAAPSALLRFHLSSQYTERITRVWVNEWDKHFQCRQLIGQIRNEAKGIEYTSAQCSTALAAIPIEPALNGIADANGGKMCLKLRFPYTSSSEANVGAGVVVEAQKIDLIGRLEDCGDLSQKSWLCSG